LKIFLDANVILDFTLKRANYNKVKTLMQKVFDDEVSAFITPSVVHISAYWIKKEFDLAFTKKVLLKLLTKITVIDIKHHLVVDALHSNMKDIEDALQYFTAIDHKIDYFISEDKKFKNESLKHIPVLSATDFFTLIHN
jgi:predicted nucleic acid-binding protein